MSSIYIGPKTNDPAQTWDIEFDSQGQLRFTASLEEAAVQGIRQRIQTWRGTWFLDTKVGIPYIESVFRKGTSSRLIESMFRSAILQVPEIQDVLQIQLVTNRQTREASLTFTARLTNNRIITSSNYQSFVLGGF